MVGVVEMIENDVWRQRQNSEDDEMKKGSLVLSCS